MNILGIVSQQAGPPPFSPLDVANCKVWLDASDTSTISLSGSQVTQWTDKTANAYQFTQGTAANRPLSGTRTQNGKNVIDFDGTNDKLVSNAANSTWNFLHNGTEHTIFVAFMMDVDTCNGFMLGTSAAIFTKIGASHGGLAGDRIFSQVSTGSSLARVVDADVTGIGDFQTFTFVSMTMKPSNATASERVAFRYESGAAQKPNTASASVVASDATDALSIGSNSTDTFPMNGVIGEIIVYDVALSDANRILIQDYLTTKWNV
ncbi:MAG TPA: hypothetical protein DCF63_15295 [Planctomycetaceae bacterium]|nr:hypothetical protein [Planctomycetaceae bacterium]